MSTEFHEIPIPPLLYGKPYFKVYFVIHSTGKSNFRSEVFDALKSLKTDEQELIKDLIYRMATNKNFKSNKITWHLKKYNYGEIKPKPHRFFFFRKCGSNLIFFDYALKKKGTLGDDHYKRINDKKEKYEQEFEAQKR